ncbi:MAG: type II toxin-antitoxin system RelE/ParE family toxin [Alphaproteobacteria bacterium]|nr:type II toxin-antitoxin system RelE/ParE family toxin [Alphaproteobacteria bacterium]
MKLAWTDAALDDLRTIAEYLVANHPDVAGTVHRRLHLVLERIAQWPESAQRVIGRPDVRVVPLVRYPYRVFYRITAESVEILHIRPMARRAPWEHD